MDGSSRSGPLARCLTREINVQELGLARHLALDGGGQPVRERDVVILRVELDLGQHQVAVPELVDLPRQPIDVHFVAALSEPAALREWPHREEDCLSRLLLDLGPRDTLAELHGAIEMEVLTA